MGFLSNHGKELGVGTTTGRAQPAHRPPGSGDALHLITALWTKQSSEHALGDKHRAEVQVTTRGSSMKWRPQLTVTCIDIGCMVQQQFHHLSLTINTTLHTQTTTVQNTTTIWITHNRLQLMTSVWPAMTALNISTNLLLYVQHG